MPKFRFELETLRKLRQARRDELRAKLADAYRAVQIIEEQQQQVRQEIAAMQEFRRTSNEAGSSDLTSMMESQRYQSVLRSQLGTFQQQSKQLEEEVEKRRLAVVEADRAVRILDKLEERKRQQHNDELQRRESKILDEIATQRFGTNY